MSRLTFGENTIVFRRRGMKTGGVLLLIFGVALVLGLLSVVVESGASKNSLANLGFYALIFWLAWIGVLKPRVIVSDARVVIDQALWVHEIPYRTLARARTSSDGAVEFALKDRRVLRSFAFGGSKFIRWTGINKRAEKLVQETNQNRKLRNRSKIFEDDTDATTRLSWTHILITAGIAIFAGVAVLIDVTSSY